MQTKSYSHDKIAQQVELGDGPWLTEPDKAQFVDPTTGLPCLIVRGPVGALCGYVGVPSSHPAFKKHYDDVPNIEVHGGLTFSGLCQPNTRGEEHGICHVVDEGEDDKVWWLGFDCSHYNDFAPKTRVALKRVGVERELDGFTDEVYRDWTYVHNEVIALALQLGGMK